MKSFKKIFCVVSALSLLASAYGHSEGLVADLDFVSLVNAEGAASYLADGKYKIVAKPFHRDILRPLEVDNYFSWLTKDVLDMTMDLYRDNSEKFLTMNFTTVIAQPGKGTMRPIEVMKIPLTQWQYLLLMADLMKADENKNENPHKPVWFVNPAHFNSGDGSLNIKIRGKKFSIKPNHPMENISGEDAIHLINKLDELDKANDLLIKLLIHDHKWGDKYRLPTEAEWDFLAVGGELNWVANRALLDNRAWHIKNSRGMTHTVGSILKMPNSFGLYDIFHVRHLTISVSGSFVARGACWNAHPRNVQLSWRRSLTPTWKSNSLGLRLIRYRENS